MFKQILGCALLLTFSAIGSSVAQTTLDPKDIPMPPVIDSPDDFDRIPMQLAVNWPLKQMAKASTTELPILGAAHIEPADLPGPDVLSEIVAWVSVISDLPIYDHPRIERASNAKMTAMRYRELLSQSQLERAVISQAMSRYHILAVYDDASKTIYLADAWTGSTPADQSILVHEMVHHLQNLAGRTYGCPQEREKLAYDAQNRWLALYERDLERDFDIHQATLLLSAECTP